MTSTPRTGLQPRRVFLVALAAALLVELAWVLSVPAFRGIDEFDHVYKAEAVAHGMWTDVGPARDGRGNLVAVPEHVVAAASRRCDSYDYTGPDNCRPVRSLDDGLVLVACAAATYNPVYYAIVGTFARPFHGAGAVFAMRVLTALLTAVLLAAAAALTAAWARGTWPVLALVVASTPTLLYSGSVASPNGVGYAAGCLLWASLLGMVRAPRRLHLLGAAVASTTILVTHSTGFVWLSVVAFLALRMSPRARWREVVRDLGRSTASAAIVVACVLVGTLGWIVVNKTNVPGADDGNFGPMPWSDLPGQVLVWAMQTVGAFPMRNQPAPLAVYALWLVLFCTLMTLGMRHAARGTRTAVALISLVWVAVPALASVVTFDTDGFAWQGRYALVLAVGLPMLAGFALDDKDRPAPRWLAVVVVASCAAAHALSVGSVAAREAHTPLAPDFAAAMPGGPWFLAALAFLGCLLTLAAAPRPVPAAVRQPPRREVLSG